MDREKLAVWLKELVKGLVKNPKDVEVAVKEPDEQGVLFTLKVDQLDAGRVIGKQGQNAAKIRAILNLAGLHHGIRASLKIDVPELEKKPK